MRVGDGKHDGLATGAQYNKSGIFVMGISEITRLQPFVIFAAFVALWKMLVAVVIDAIVVAFVILVTASSLLLLLFRFGAAAEATAADDDVAVLVTLYHYRHRRFGLFCLIAQCPTALAFACTSLLICL